MSIGTDKSLFAGIGRLSGGALFGVWLFGAPATADENYDAKELLQLPFEQLMDMEVESASRFPQKATDAPSAVTVITAPNIKAYGYRTLADILKSIRGLYVSNDRNYSYLGTRGFSRPGDYNSRILLLVDGYRTNDAIFDQALIGTEFFLDVENIDRVEFVPGPGSAVYGGNAFFGVINIITKQGKDYQGAALSGEVASQETHRGRGVFGKQFDNGLDVLVSASGYESSGNDHLFYREFDTTDQNNGVAENLDDDRYQRFFSKLSFEGVTLEGIYSERKKDIPTAAFGQVFNDPRSHTVDQNAFVNLKYYGSLAEKLEAAGSVYYGQYNYDGDYIYDNPPLTVNKDGSRSQWWGAEFKLTSTWLEKHTTIFGAEYQNDFQRKQFNFDDAPRSVLLDTDNPAYRFGVYLQDEFAIFDNLILNAGVRFDYNSTDTNDGTLDHRSINPRAALIYKPFDLTTVKLLYGTAFRRPNAYELFYDAAEFRPNPDLRPEKIKTYEIVVEQYFGRNTRLTANAFSYEISNLISLETDSQDLLFFDNVGKTRAVGIEAEGEHFWSNGARIRASYSWQQAKDGEDGAWLTNSPRHLAKVNFYTPVYRDWFRLGLEWQFASERKTLSGDRVDAFHVSNVTLTTDKLFAGTPLKGLEISGSIYNLFDERFSDPASEEHEQDSILQEGRLFRLIVTYGF